MALKKLFQHGVNPQGVWHHIWISKVNAMPIGMHALLACRPTSPKAHVISAMQSLFPCQFSTCHAQKPHGLNGKKFTLFSVSPKLEHPPAWDTPTHLGIKRKKQTRRYVLSCDIPPHNDRNTSRLARDHIHSQQCIHCVVATWDNMSIYISNGTAVTPRAPPAHAVPHTRSMPPHIASPSLPSKKPDTST